MTGINRQITLPLARLINGHTIVKNIYTDPKGNDGTPQYKVEVAISKDATGDDSLQAFIDLAYEVAEEKWGAIADDDLHLPVKDGDEMAIRREASGKAGDAYKGMDVLRATTIYNSDGNDAPGGISHYDEDLNELDAIQAQKLFYNGCQVYVSAVLNPWVDGKTHQKSISLYLQAIQYGGEGERLSSTDHKSAFKPRKAEARSEGGSRRRTRTG